jgi:ribosomal protein S18 acetylase RimI-like enzyme
VTLPPTLDGPRPATAAPADDLLELLQEVRREVALHEEDPTGEWVERSVEELRAGRKPGWFYARSDGGGGIAFANVRGARAWGHVHSTEEERSRRLAVALLDGLGNEIVAVSLGFTGLTVEDERRLAASLSSRPGAAVIERYAMERPLRAEDTAGGGDAPVGLRRVAVRDVTLAALAELDWRAFRGSLDDLMVGGSPEEYARMITSLLENGQGRSLDAASTVLLASEPDRLIGGVLTSEISSREAIFLDLIVDPESRGQGLGRFLLRWALRALRGLGYEKVRLWVTATNTVALRLYDSEGFGRVATTIIYRWDRPAAGPQPQRSR